MKSTSQQFLEARLADKPRMLVSSILKILKQSYGEFCASGWLPLSFKRGGKTYKGVYAFGDKHVLRFEFYSDIMVSVSVFNTGESLDAAPAYMVEIESPDTLAAATMIAEAIATGTLPSEPIAESSGPLSKALKEATMDDIRRFVDETGDEGGSLSAAYRKYVKWAEAAGMKVVSDITFSDYFKKIRQSTGVGGTSSPSAVSVVRGVADDPGNTEIEYDEFEKDVLNNNVFYKYEMMNEIVKRIVTWDPLYKNAFIYGTGGVGKTYTVTQVINEFAKKSEITMLSGAISGFTGLLQVLWQNRERKIIILDDCDTVLANETALNLLKKAMDSGEPRILSYMRLKKGAPAPKQEAGIHVDVSRLHEKLVTLYIDGVKQAEESITTKEARWYEKVSGVSAETHALHEALDIADAEDEYAEDDEFAKLDANVDPAYGMNSDEAVPDQFQFTSRIIFISNLLVVPQPLLDRCLLVGLILTKEQVLDLIESLLDNILKKEAPEITLELKKEVLLFMRTYVHRITKSLTFRLFSQLCAIFYSGHPNYKKIAYMSLISDVKTKFR